MAKVNEYKQYQLMCHNKATETKKVYDDNRTALENCWKDGDELYATFELKRRQGVSTWATQIRKGLVKYLEVINVGRRKAKLPPWTEEDIPEDICKEYTQSGYLIVAKLFDLGE